MLDRLREALLLDHSEAILHLYGMTNGVFFCVSALLLLIAISYAYSRDTRRIALTFFFFATGYFMFGLYNIFYQGFSGAITTQIIPAFLFTLSKFGAPIALMIMTKVFTSLASVRSFNAYQFINRNRYITYTLYGINIAFIAIVFFITDTSTIAFLTMGLFLPHCIGALAVCLLGLSGVRFSKLLAGLFIFCALQVLGSCYLIYTDQIILADNVLVYFHFFFSIIVIVFSFICIRYGYDDAQSYFDNSRLDQKNLIPHINKALTGNQFFLVFQPKVDLNSNEIHSAEALVRWNHPTLGIIGPGDFMPAIERNNTLVNELCKQVIEHAVNAIKILDENGYPLKISINFSANNLNTEITDYLENCIQSNQLPNNCLTIEITETYFVQETSTSNEALSKLASLGVLLSLDDYGTGFSSLSSIKKLALSELKIDRSYISDIDTNQDNYIITQSTINMAKSLGLAVVAEGIENEEVANTLRKLGCDTAQGYYYAKPMPLSKLLQWLQENKKTF